MQQAQRLQRLLFFLTVYMKSITLLFSIVCLLATRTPIHAQDDIKTMHETAKTFMRSGDFDNAILVLTRALQQKSNDLELQKDLVMSYYFKRDYVKALDKIKPLLDREDADVVVYQIGGNIYKALEEVKECEKVYKKGLKKFPKSGPLYSEYGELLWAAQNFSAIDQWEAGIRNDPGYSGNYYNAARFYFYSKDKVWSLIYGEIFVNMESLGERGALMKNLLLQGYKEKLFTDADLLKGEEKNKSEFAKAFLTTMAGQSSLANKGITTTSLSMIRTRFVLDWFESSFAAKYPFRLFELQQQFLKNGTFDAYNQWLFGSVEDQAAFDNWTKEHNEEYTNLTNFQKNRVFKMPAGQYYQVK